MCVTAVIISSVQERDRDERWFFQLVLCQLNLSTPIARGYHRHNIARYFDPHLSAGY
jgi:hypothetical protein